MLDALLDLMLPPICLACDQLIATGDSKRLVCRRCRTRLRKAPPPLCGRCRAPRLITGRQIEKHCEECREWPPELERADSAFLMHAPADRIVHQLKYRGWAALADVMAQPMADAVLTSDVAWRPDVIMPVPTTGARQRERGYNQAELIARGVATRLNCACELLLERTSSKSTQTTLQPAARGANVAGAFRLRSDARERMDAAHILIVDDVLTTGATAIECTRTLIESGARCASVLTYARAVDTRRLLAT
ncbi:MAG: double zinc ribbon domain-containing protein [Gemmatimonadota bacterium]